MLNRAQDIVGQKIWPGDYRKTATVAEALLIQKQYQAKRRHTFTKRPLPWRQMMGLARDDVDAGPAVDGKTRTST